LSSPSQADRVSVYAADDSFHIFTKGIVVAFGEFSLRLLKFINKGHPVALSKHPNMSASAAAFLVNNLMWISNAVAKDQDEPLSAPDGEVSARTSSILLKRREVGKFGENSAAIC
jgi:hypothetical protein